MAKRSKGYTRKGIALIVMPALSVSATWLFNAVHCLSSQCIEADASRRADAMIGDIVFLAYVAVSLFIVFLPALALRRYFGALIASASSPLVVALAISASFSDPQVNDLPGVLLLFFFIAAPWFIANLAGLAIWPSQEGKPATVDIDCFS